MTAGSVYDKPQKTSNLYFNPSTQTLTSTNFTGNFNGTSSSSATITTNSLTTSTLCYPVFTSSTAGLSKALYVDDTPTTLTYNPSTGVLTSVNFTGSLTGLASTATLATNSSNVNLATTLTLATHIRDNINNFRCYRYKF